jgi:hypothetical protein
MWEIFFLQAHICTPLERIPVRTEEQQYCSLTYTTLVQQTNFFCQQVWKAPYRNFVELQNNYYDMSSLSSFSSSSAEWGNKCLLQKKNAVVSVKLKYKRSQTKRKDTRT